MWKSSPELRKGGGSGSSKNTPQTKPKEQTLGVAQMHQGVTRRDCEMVGMVEMPPRPRASLSDREGARDNSRESPLTGAGENRRKTKNSSSSQCQEPLLLRAADVSVWRCSCAVQSAD